MQQRRNRGGGGGLTDDHAPRLNERAAFQSIGGNSCWQCCCCCCCCSVAVAVATKRGRQQQQLALPLLPLLRMLLCLIKRLPRCEAATLVVTFARPIDTHLNDDNDAAGAALDAYPRPLPAPSSCCTASLALFCASTLFPLLSPGKVIFRSLGQAAPTQLSSF